MKKFNLKNIFQNFKKPQGSIERDWKIIVIIFGIILVLLSAFVWQIYLSDKIGGGYLTSPMIESETIIKIVDKKRLQANLLFFETRSADYLESKNSVTVVDPSL